MPEQKHYNVTLLKGFSHMTKDGATFYQNRTRSVMLTEEQVNVMASMESGHKFSVVPLEQPSAPAAEDEGKDGEGDAAGDAAGDASEGEPSEPSDDSGDEPPDPFDEEDEEKGVDIFQMTVPQLKKYLDDNGVEYSSGARRDALRQLAAAVPASD